MFDPMNDADWETAELQDQANFEQELKRQGHCAHPARQGIDGANLFNGGFFRCMDCGKVATDEELEEERQDLLAGL